jgi:hypothetical protein
MIQYTSESRIVRHSNGYISDTFWVRLSNGLAIEWSGPDLFVQLSNGITSLDRIIKKRVIKNILFMTKRSRLESPAFKWSGTDQFVRLSNGLAAILFLPFESQSGYFSH